MLINLDNAKKALETLKAFSSDPQSLYIECDKQKGSLTSYLEKLDPSECDESGVPVSKFDAFDRLLMAMDIQLSGQNAFTLEKLMSTGTEMLVPEMIKREVEAGMSMAARSSYKELIAATVPTDQSTYHPIYVPDLNLTTAKNRREKSLGSRAATNKGAEFPKYVLRHREKDIMLGDYGRTLEAPYSMLKGKAWPDIRVFLWLLGAQLAIDKLFDIYDLAIHGDGTVGAATDVFNGTAGTLSYADLVHAYASFDTPFNMTALINPQQSEEQILTMPQFQDPLSGWEFQKTGKMVTPMGAILRRVGPTPAATPTGTIIVALDTRFAVREIKSQNLMVESEKIINRKFEAATISEESAFCIIADGAIKQIDWS